MNQHPPYTPEERAWMRANYTTAAKEDIMAALPNRQWKAIQNLAAKMRVVGRPTSETSVWTAERTALLRQHYPSSGPAITAQILGMSKNSVLQRACRLKLAYAPYRAAPYKPVPRPQGRTAVLPSTKESPLTPNLNAAKKARKSKEDSEKLAAPYTASEIRKMGYDNPIRMAHMRDGTRGIVKYFADLRAIALAAA